MTASNMSRGARAVVGLLFLLSWGFAPGAHADCSPVFTGDSYDYPDQDPYTVTATMTATPTHVQPGGRVRLDVKLTSTFPSCGSRDISVVTRLPSGGTPYGQEGTSTMPCYIDDSGRFACSSIVTNAQEAQLNDAQPQSFSFVVNAPSSPGTFSVDLHVKSGYGSAGTLYPYDYSAEYSGPGTPQAYADVSNSITVDPVNAYAYTYVPQNTPVTLQTAAVEAVTTASPVFGKAEFPALPVGYLARVFVTTNGPDLNTACLLGFLYAANGQAYLCRDTQVLAGLLGPVLGGNGQGKRWVVTDTVDLADGNQINFPPASPVQITLRQHSSLISPLQALNLFPYGVFYTTTDLTAPRVASTLCSTNGNVPPCLTAAAAKQSDGSYRATYRISSAQLVAATTPVDHLLALMDFVLGPVGAGTIKPPILTK